MLKLNEAPNIVLHKLRKANFENHLRFFPQPIPFVITCGSLDDTIDPFKKGSEEKIYLKNLIKALEGLKIKSHKNITNDTIDCQVKETFNLLKAACNSLLNAHYSRHLEAARYKIVEKMKEEERTANAERTFETRPCR